MPGAPQTDPPVDEIEPVYAGGSAEERVYGALVQSSDPVRVADIVDKVECSTDTARKYLEWFVTLGVARKQEGRPTVYERNEEYFEWRYVTHLADTHSIRELRETVADLQERLDVLRDRYGTREPGRVTLEDAAEANDATIEAVWDDLTTWDGLEEEIRLYDRARQRLSDRGDIDEASAD